MINLITDSRNVATLLLAFVVATSMHVETPKAQEESNGFDQSIVINAPAPDLGQQEAGTAETETSYSVFEPQTVEAAAPQTEDQPDQQPTVPEVSPPAPQTEDQPVQQPVPDVSPPTPPNETALPADIENSEDPNLDVLMRGPLHEAFAEVYQHDAKPSPIIKREPPAAVEELPPEYKPDGENVQWIPGFWAWDEDREDFIWVSGIWRDVPPGQRWVPGYWQSLDDGYRWVSGFWTSEDQEELEYLPQPPLSIDNGPSYAAPSDEHFYTPGNWVYQNNNYAWQSGYWSRRSENWVWIPARYIWTPNGCIYRSGYWDREIARRGVVFAPVCFNTPVYRQVSYRYTPSCVVNTNYDFLVHLFVRPSCNQYYFGDWYNNRYASRNIYPWVNYHRTSNLRRAYDPLYAYYNCRSKRYRNAYLMSWIRNQHQYYHHYQDYRPRHTFSAQIAFASHSRQRYTNFDAIRRASFCENYKTQVYRHQNNNAFAHNKYHRLENLERVVYADSVAPIRDISRRRQSHARNHDHPYQAKIAKLDLRHVERDSKRQPEQIRKQAKTFDRATSREQDFRKHAERKIDQENKKQTRIVTADQKKIDRFNREQQAKVEKAAKGKERETGKTLARRSEDQRKKLESQRRDDQRSQKQVSDQARRAIERAQTKVARDQKAQQQDLRKKAVEQIAAQKRRQEKLNQQNRKSAGDTERLRKQVEARQIDERKKQTRVVQKQARKDQHDSKRIAQIQETQRNAAKRDADIQAKQRIEARLSAQKTRETLRRQQKRLDDQLSRQARDAQQRQSKQLTSQREVQKRAQQQLEAQQQARQRETQKRTQQQRVSQRQAGQQKALLAAQQRARRDAQQRTQRDALKRAQQESQKQAQRRADQKRQAQRQADQQKQAQQRADKQRQAQQRADQQRQAKRQADQQRQVQRKADQQRQAQRRAEQQRAKQQSQQRAQREAQQRAQRNAAKQRQQAQRSKKKGK